MKRASNDLAVTPDPGLSWSQLRSFQACLRLGSFTASAAVLGVTAAAVRQQVGLLEGRLGASLFLRRSGQLVPTAAGTSFGLAIDRPLRALSSACAQAAEVARLAPLTLSAPPLFARRFLLNRTFIRWCADNGVSLDISEEKRRVNECLAAIRLNPEIELGVTTERLSEVQLGLAAALVFAADAAPRQRSWWRSQILLSPQVGEAAWSLLWQNLGLDDVAVAGRLQFTSYAAALDAAANGSGLVLAPLPLAASDVSGGILTRLDAPEVRTRSAYELLMDSSLATSRRGRALRRYVKGAVDAAQWPSQAPTWPA